MRMKKRLLRLSVFAICLCLFLGMGTTVTAAASTPEARFIIMILPPDEQATAVIIQIEDTGGTGFVDAQVKLGENGHWHDITACLMRDRTAYFEITHSGRVYVSVTDNAGVAHVSSRHIEFAGTAPPVPPPTPPTPPAPPTIPTPSPDTSTAPAVPTVPTEPTEPTTPGAPGNVSVTPIDGTGTVIENSIQTPETREFFTIETQRGGIFYLVIDRERPEANVYLLSEVTEENLAGFIRQDEPEPGEPPPTVTPMPQPEIPVITQPEPQPEIPVAPPPAASDSSSSSIFLIIFIVLAVGGAGYYIKIVRPKRESADPFGDDEDDYEDDDIPEDEDDEEIYEYEVGDEQGDDNKRED